MPTQATGGRNGGGRGKYRQANKQLSESVSEYILVSNGLIFDTMASNSWK
jgi:hypothetical protein